MAEPVKIKKVPTIVVPDKKEIIEKEVVESKIEKTTKITLEEAPKDILEIEESEDMSKTHFDFAEELWKAMKK